MTATVSSKVSFAVILFTVSSSFASADCRQDRFLFQESRRLFLSKQALLSSLQFSRLRVSDCADLASRSWVGYALSVSELNENVEALNAISEGLLDPRLIPEDRDSLRMLRTWIQGHSSRELSVDQNRRWKLWEDRLDRVRFTGLLDSLPVHNAEVGKLRVLQETLVATQSKSPLLSGVASTILPGAGQAYLGNWQSAALSFVINAAILGATLEFARKDMPAAAVAGAGVFSITYLGNIVGTVKSANEINRFTRSQNEADLKRALLPELSF